MGNAMPVSTLINRLAQRKEYWSRIVTSYLLASASEQTFWREDPQINERVSVSRLGPYYMAFRQKALYSGPCDENGVPFLDYHGTVGKQYYPIAIAQYALGNYNLYAETNQTLYKDRFLTNATWLLHHLHFTPSGTYLWPSHFDFHYFRPLKAPWYSGLAQGQGLSVLVRAYHETREDRFLLAAQKVLETLSIPIGAGGVTYRDANGDIWIEEYLVDPPTHILNGFIWALWGVFDYCLLTGEPAVRKIFDALAQTILTHLPRYDAGFWSYYELTPQRIKSISSSLYHRLHIIQLQIMNRMTGHVAFAEYATRWQEYYSNVAYRGLASAYKIGFKVLYH